MPRPMPACTTAKLRICPLMMMNITTQLTATLARSAASNFGHVISR